MLDGERRDIFKDPKTDSGTKKSAKGLLRVEHEGDNLVLYDQLSETQEDQGALEVVYLDGKLVKQVTLAEVRQRLDKEV